MSDEISWMAVKSRSGDKVIGAIAFVGEEPAVILAYYDEADANKDGKVSFAERAASFLSPIGLGGTGVMEVLARGKDQAIAATANPNGSQMTSGRASNVSAMLGSQITQVGMQMAMDGFFKAYIGTGINVGVGKAGAALEWNMIKGFAVKKGMEAAAKKAFEAATQ